jgi:signal transduction histidine kinase
MISAQNEPRTILTIPLISGGRWLGIINIYGQHRSVPDSRTLRFLKNLADRAAVALDSARLYAETQQRAIHLEAAAKVSRAATSILEQEKLLSSVVELIRDHFDYYHAQVFLLDPTERWAVLRASIGEPGRKLLRHGHTLEVGDDSLIGHVTSTGEPGTTYDVQADSRQTIDSHLLDTRSQLAIPLKIGGRVIGALDVHSIEPIAFGSDEIAVLSTLADQLAVAIENARLYQEQLETAKKLREVDRLKTQFLANMSHELRTPLNSIIGFSRVILKGIDGPVTDLQRQDLTAIYSSGQLLLQLINDILDLSKIEAGKMELVFAETELYELIQGVIATTMALVKEKRQIELRQNIASDLPLIIADATRLRQVLLNLLSNAVKFTEEGHVDLSATHDSRSVTFQVSDTGIGIPADKFDLIFQEFQQVDGSSARAAGGTGLGLPISKYLVEMHGGRTWVESTVGIGSTFTVQIPIRGPNAAVEGKGEAGRTSKQSLILSTNDATVRQPTQEKEEIEE